MATFPAVRGGHFRDTMGAPRARPGGHRGTDIPAPIRSPIVAMKSGIVARVYDRLSSANHCGYGISIEHPADRIRYTYCHMYTPPAHEDGTPWQQGEHVEEDDFLGIIGTTGSSTGPHLHIQAITNSGQGHAINLYPMLMRAFAAQEGRPMASGLTDSLWGPGARHGAAEAPRAGIPPWLVVLGIYGITKALRGG